MSRAGSWTGTAHSGQNSLIFQPEHKDTTRETKANIVLNKDEEIKKGSSH